LDNVLIITNADMSLQSGDIVLINRRAEELYKTLQIHTTCAIIERGNISINHEVEGINYITFFSKENIKVYIEENKPKGIILYGIRTYKYVTYLKNVIKKLGYTTKIFLDIQGALEEGIEYSQGINKFKNYTKYLTKRILLSQALNKVDGAFVVSDELKEYCFSLMYKQNPEFRFFKVRCGINKVISTEQKLEWRNTIRNKWKVNEDTIVMVFSGYRMPWQNIDKIIQLFKKYDKELNNVFFAFFCNIDDQFEKRIKNVFKKGNYTLKFLSFNEYFKYLSACDVGFIIRDKNITNRVAFPNKFSDYMNAGLLVALDKNLPEPLRVIANSGIKYIDIEQGFDYRIEELNERLLNIKEHYEKSEYLCENELLYSNQIVNSGFGEFIRQQE
jgi:glycosyltransferase involved in cell wall biosynthesis